VSVIVAERFHSPKPIIGIVSLPPLSFPGEPGELASLMDRAEQETLAWLSAGVDGLLVENTLQPLTVVPDYMVSVLTLVVQRVVRLCNKPVGVSVLDNHPGLAASIAWSTGAQWVRQPVAAGCRISATGLLNAQMAPPVLGLLTVSDVTLDHTLPGSTHTLAYNMAHMPGDALLIAASQLTTALEAKAANNTVPTPVWVLDDGSPPDIERLPLVDGLVLRPSVLRTEGSLALQTVDPQKAKRWVDGFKTSVLQQA
jgi:predicted TIM-barrel enzyme